MLLRADDTSRRAAFRCYARYARVATLMLLLSLGAMRRHFDAEATPIAAMLRRHATPYAPMPPMPLKRHTRRAFAMRIRAYRLFHAAAADEHAGFRYTYYADISLLIAALMPRRPYIAIIRHAR